VEVSGSGLHLTAMDRDNIRIRGRIDGVAYLDRE
jgi:hypothetical protein